MNLRGYFRRIWLALCGRSEWHHLQVVKEDGTIRVFVDGAELEKGEAPFQRSKEAELPIRVSPETKRNVGLKP